MNAPAPISSEDVDGVIGYLGMVVFTPKEQDLLHELLLRARAGESVLRETLLSGVLYNGKGENGSNEDALDKLIKRLNDRLDPLGLAVLGHGSGESRCWHLARQCALPIPQNPQFRWSVSVKGAERREPNPWQFQHSVWVPRHGINTEVSFRVEREVPWTPPPGFVGYEEHRKKTWESYLDRRQNSPNSPHWHVAHFTLKTDRHGNKQRAVELTLRPVNMQDVIATTWSLKEPQIRGDHGETTILEWLRKHRTQSPFKCTHFPPAANPLLIEVNVITEDNYLIVRAYNGAWESALFGYMDALQDVHRSALHVPDPSETVFRKACQQLGLSVDPRVSWLGVGFGLLRGKVSLLGELNIGLSQSQVLVLAKEKGANLDFIKLKPRAVCEYLAKTSEPRHHFGALAALSLKRHYPEDVTIAHARDDRPKVGI